MPERGGKAQQQALLDMLGLMARHGRDPVVAAHPETRAGLDDPVRQPIAALARLLGRGRVQDRLPNPMMNIGPAGGGQLPPGMPPPAAMAGQRTGGPELPPGAPMAAQNPGMMQRIMQMMQMQRGPSPERQEEMRRLVEMRRQQRVAEQQATERAMMDRINQSMMEAQQRNYAGGGVTGGEMGAMQGAVPNVERPGMSPRVLEALRRAGVGPGQ